MKNRVIATLSIISFIFTLIALGLSINAICIRYPRFNMEFDYLGLLIGLATFLVALTVGWQIYTIVDTKSSIQDQNINLNNAIETQNKKIDAIQEKLNNIKEDIDSSTLLSRVEAFTAVGQAASFTNDFWAAIPYLLMTLQLYDQDCINEPTNNAFKSAIKTLKNILPPLKEFFPDHYNLKNFNYSKSTIIEFKKGIHRTGDEVLIEWSLRFVSGQD